MKFSSICKQKWKGLLLAPDQVNISKIVGSEKGRGGGD